jgi:GntR family transcriptional regulator, transcriptional repressor for pyruvate dehydrogenase complex
MTRHLRDVALAYKADKTMVSKAVVGKAAAVATGLLQSPLVARNLTTDVVERIGGEIRSGALQPGQRLPTEQDLVAALGVSRTVIREAMSALKADGLITTRQGSGAFVSDDAARRPFRLLSEPTSQTVENIREVLELRLAVEVESARLAARRGTAASLKRIGRAQAAFDRAVSRGELAAVEDFELHRSIAAATGNPQFQHFLGFLGTFIIPRLGLNKRKQGSEVDVAYLQRLAAEHAAICNAISERDEDAAATAMRRHLLQSLERYGNKAKG